MSISASRFSHLAQYAWINLGKICSYERTLNSYQSTTLLLHELINVIHFNLMMKSNHISSSLMPPSKRKCILYIHFGQIDSSEYVCVCIYLCLCICVYAFICLCMYVYIYICMRYVLFGVLHVF